jgi:serine/threonine protein kinase
VIKKIIRGVIYLQKLGILHRDLKPENIMLEFSNEEKKTIKNVKIVDFGLSQLLCHAEKLSGSQAIGTPNYIAP